MYILQSWAGQKDCVYDMKDISKFEDIKDNSYFNYRRFWILVNFLILKCNYIANKCCITLWVKILSTGNLFVQAGRIFN